MGSPITKRLTAAEVPALPSSYVSLPAQEVEERIVRYLPSDQKNTLSNTYDEVAIEVFDADTGKIFSDTTQIFSDDTSKFPFPIGLQRSADGGYKLNWWNMLVYRWRTGYEVKEGDEFEIQYRNGRLEIRVLPGTSQSVNGKTKIAEKDTGKSKSWSKYGCFHS